MSGANETEGRIAIIGMSGRFPGAQDIATFWRNLSNGVESVTFFNDDQLEDGVEPSTRASASYVKARPVLPDVDQFDAGFFDMRDREAALTDPQHRIFLECAWEALEDAGYDPAAYRGAIGVFAGCSMNTYFLNNVCRDRKVIEDFTGTFQVGDYPVLMGAGREFLATRVGVQAGLAGPGSDRSDCLLDLAGRGRAGLPEPAPVPVRHGAGRRRIGLVSAASRLSASGRRHGFGGRSLPAVRRVRHRHDLRQRRGRRPLEAAGGRARRRRPDLRVILGCGLSNDGAGKVGFTAPSVDGQVAAIEQALAQAGVAADSISYIECHGTATPLGDPIEVTALTKAFRKSTEAQGYCAIGSVKGNIGHLDAAAGVAGLIKTTLMLRHRELAPSLNFQAPNPRIAFEGGPFFVNATRAPWPGGVEARRAGVTSLGVGGTNAHVVLEEPPTRVVANAAPRPELLVLSARSPSALAQMRARLGDHLAANPDAPLADIAFTLQRGRRRFRHRFAVACRDHADAQALLSRTPSRPRKPGRSSRRAAVRGLHVSRTGRAIRRDGARALPALPSVPR